MRDTFLWVPGKEMTPKRNNKTQGYIEGCHLLQTQTSSTRPPDHIGWAFQHLQWLDPKERHRQRSAEDR